MLGAMVGRKDTEYWILDTEYWILRILNQNGRTTSQILSGHGEQEVMQRGVCSV